MTPPTAQVLADPRVRLAAGAAVLLVTAVAARRGRVGPGEAAAFRAVNDLPGWLYPPAWAVMQAGTIGAAPVAAGAALLAGDRDLAGRLLAGGTSAWALSKAVKRFVQRPRPAGLLPGTRRRGREPTGLGYLSGHAGVAVTLGAAAFPRLGPGGRALILASVPVVGLTRIYVGAHLPLDVAGGAALGVVIDAALSLASSRSSQAGTGALRHCAGQDGPTNNPSARGRSALPGHLPACALSSFPAPSFSCFPLAAGRLPAFPIGLGSGAGHGCHMRLRRLVILAFRAPSRPITLLWTLPPISRGPGSTAMANMACGTALTGKLIRGRFLMRPVAR